MADDDVKPPEDPVVPEVVPPVGADGGARPVFTRDRPDGFASNARPGVAVYQGERSLVEPAPAAPVTAVSANGKASVSLKKMGITRNEAKFLRELTGGSRTQLEAWNRAFPRDRAQESTKRIKASRWYRKIIAKCADHGIDEFELMGVGKIAILAGVRKSMEAKAVKAFIDVKTGLITESRPYDDNAVQLAAVKLAAEMQGMVKQEKGGAIGQVIVNVVQYNPPGTPAWPGGGRS